MVIKDRIYGNIEIKEKVISDIIKTPIFERLKGISQDGAPHFIQPERNVTRYEHSIGVWYLSHKFNRPIEEQIACILHDLSHTAFSHVIDFVMDNAKHEYADEKLKQFIYESEIPKILKENYVDLEKVLAKENFPLLENTLPDISVDRWDYFMRDSFAIGFLPKDLIDLFLNNIFEKDEKFYFKDKRLASTFSILFANFSRLIWLDPTSHGSFFLLSSALKLGLKDNLITEDDFFLTDSILFEKLKESKNPKLLELLDRLKSGNEFVYSSKEESEFYGPNKPRTVDPLVLQDGELVRLSSIVPNLGYFFEEFNKNYKYLGVKRKMIK